MRSTLWASVVYNLGGTLLFVFPSSLGRLAGLPGPVPRVYTALLAVFVALFGGAYAWLPANRASTGRWLPWPRWARPASSRSSSSAGSSARRRGAAYSPSAETWHLLPSSRGGCWVRLPIPRKPKRLAAPG